MKGSLLLFPYSFVQGSAYLRSSMIWVNEGYSGTWTEVVVSAPFEDRIARLGWIITSFNWGVFHVNNEQIIWGNINQYIFHWGFLPVWNWMNTRSALLSTTSSSAICERFYLPGRQLLAECKPNVPQMHLWWLPLAVFSTLLKHVDH